MPDLFEIVVVYGIGTTPFESIHEANIVLTTHNQRLLNIIFHYLLNNEYNLTSLFILYYNIMINDINRMIEIIVSNRNV